LKAHLHSHARKGELEELNSKTSGARGSQPANPVLIDLSQDNIEPEEMLPRKVSSIYSLLNN